jgi:hypothetical protein
MSHRIAFRHQRAIFVFVVLGLIILFSTAVLWGHYETVVTRYQWLAKAGLALVDVIAIGLAIWHLYAKHAPLKVWCYIADGAIAAMMIVHAGAVLQLDASTVRQVAQVQTAAEAQAKLREADAAVEAARIKAAGEAAAAVKQQTGSNALANRTLRIAETKQDARAAEALTKMAADMKPQTFLSDAYMHGGVYYWPALIALGFFMVAVGISAVSLPYEDANQNSIPDWLERALGRSVTPPVQSNFATTKTPDKVGTAPFFSRKIRRPLIRPMYADTKRIDQPTKRENLSTATEKTPEKFSEKKDTAKTHVSFDFAQKDEGLKNLRETLKDISFYHPGTSFKADLKSDCVWIRAMRANQGTQETVSSVKAKLDILTDAVTMPSDAFRERLENFLRENRFEI